MNKSEIINYIEQSDRLPKINKEFTNIILFWKLQIALT